MAFDAAMMACVLHEIKTLALGARIEKVYQPENDEIILQMRSFEGGKRLLINAGLNNPRICFSESKRENPMTPPMLCMLLRKYLTGAKLSEIIQPNFERIAMLKFETRDEMGFECVRYLIAEIMGKYSNLIFADGELRVISALRTVDLATSNVRQILPGIKYELPPPQQNKKNPLELESADDFAAEVKAYLESGTDILADKFILSRYFGISSSLAREIVWRAAKRSDALLCDVDAHKLGESFIGVMRDVREERFEPSIVYVENRPVEYGIMPYLHYGDGAVCETFESAGKLLDTFFEARDKDIRIKQRASDILRILTSSESRLIKKIEIQKSELADCKKGEQYRRYGDLITANLGMLRRGDKKVTLVDYADYREDGTFGTYEIELDSRLSPSANAQVMYKKYNKSKTATVELARQIEIAERELEYIYTVFDALTHAETIADMNEIREELSHSGYASRMKNSKHIMGSRKQSAPIIAKYKTSEGMTVLCGKNNTQNDYITFKLAEKMDYWFHVKGAPGSHVVLVTNGEEPADSDFTEAAGIAAYNSKVADGQNVGVDYTLAKNVKKPSGSKPGFVIYNTNYTAYVTPDKKKIEQMRVK